MNLPEIEKSVMPWIGKTGKLMATLVMERFKQHRLNLTIEQWVTLKMLHQEDGRIQNDLAMITNRNKTSLTRLINTMEKNDLVIRKSHELDKRIKLIFLTAKGKSVFKKTFPIMERLIEEIHFGVKEKEVEMLISILKKIQTNISKIAS